MAKPADNPQKFISQISLVGRSDGVVKTLAGFRKQHHTVPDAVNATTTAFLGKLCTSELAQEGEDFYQRAKTLLDYKRKDLSLDLASPTAVLTTRDFTLEIIYALELGDPTSYLVTRTLHSLRNGNLVQQAEFDELFTGLFSGIIFALTKGVSVEAVIDAVEGLGETSTVSVSYPSDCRYCVLSVEGVAANVHCDGATLEMRFPHNGSPRELVEIFAAIRSAFGLTKNRTLSSLIT